MGLIVMKHKSGTFESESELGEHYVDAKRFFSFFPEEKIYTLKVSSPENSSYLL